MRTTSFSIIAVSIALLMNIIAFAGSPFDTTSEPFQADVYPSRKTTIDRLVAQVIRELSETPNFDPNGMQIDVAQEGMNEATFKESVITLLKDAFEKATITPTNQPRTDEKTLAVSVTAIDEMDAKNPTPRAGRINITYGGGKIGSRTLTARFVEKPWADDFSSFTNANSKTRWLTAQSPSPGTSADEAISSARRATRPELHQLVETELNARAARAGGPRIHVSDEWLAQRVLNSLQLPSNDGILIKDTFVQKFSRPYGDVWQAAVLIDASPKVIGQLADSYTRAANARSSSRNKGFAAMAGIAAVIGLLYLFLNAVTRGYFMWRLRAVAILAAIAGVLVLFVANT